MFDFAKIFYKSCRTFSAAEIVFFLF